MFNMENVLIGPHSASHSMMEGRGGGNLQLSLRNFYKDSIYLKMY